MSRQRIRASVLESSTEPCPQCGGSGHVRSVSSVALQLLRGLEEILMKGATHNLVVRTRTDVALYVLNHKRGHLRDLESSFKVTLAVIADPTVSGQQSFIIDRGEMVHTLEAAKALLGTQVATSAAAPSRTPRRAPPAWGPGRRLGRFDHRRTGAAGKPGSRGCRRRFRRLFARTIAARSPPRPDRDRARTAACGHAFAGPGPRCRS